jgi:hypothetical protein
LRQERLVAIVGKSQPSGKKAASRSLDLYNPSQFYQNLPTTPSAWLNRDRPAVKGRDVRPFLRGRERRRRPASRPLIIAWRACLRTTPGSLLVDPVWGIGPWERVSGTGSVKHMWDRGRSARPTFARSARHSYKWETAKASPSTSTVRVCHLLTLLVFRLLIGIYSELESLSFVTSSRSRCLWKGPNRREERYQSIVCPQIHSQR